jgi:prephenate dehydratase
MRVAFLGPEGTFSEEALFAAMPREDVEPVPKPTIYDCVMAVQGAQADRALVPIENSLEGSVNATLDALVFETDRVRIVGEVVHPIQHSLIAREAFDLSEIQRVVSHPQASAQCARFLRSRLSGVEVVPAASTADAVRLVAEATEPWAALGTGLSAELYGCTVLFEGVEDVLGNETRFVWLEQLAADLQAGGDAEGAGGTEPPRPVPGGTIATSYKTSIVFWGLPDAPGALVRVLQEFAMRGVNLSKIESRPLKQGLGRYIFFADLEGHESDEAIVSALAAVESCAETLRILGTYPAA